MSALSAGTHSLSVVFNDGGVAKAEFKIVSNNDAAAVPDTGLSAGAGGGSKITGAAVVVAVVITVGVAIKKEIKFFS